MGYCVEPIPRHVKTLREKAKDLPVAVCECAISDRTGTVRMAVGDGEPYGEKWADGVSHIIGENQNMPGLLDRPVNAHLKKGEIEAASITLDEFLRKYNMNEIELCRIDVETHVTTILQQYSCRAKPKLIKYEHMKFPANLLEQIFLPLGYTIFVELEDIYRIL